jgi:uncharacterized cofD-like protein
VNGPDPRPVDRRPGSLRRWLRPGIGIKRWLAVVFLGELMLALAIAVVIRQLYRDLPPTDPVTRLLDFLSLQFLPTDLRPLVLVGLGLAIFVFGVWRLLRTLLEPLRVSDEPIVEMVFAKRWRARGPRIVAIGGGTGLSTLLRGLKESTSNITAVVTVADDGGSSGRLRAELGVPPMGDIRNCMAALADAEPAMTRLLQYRFGPNGRGRTERAELEGHAVGNLLLAALTDIEGDFEEAVRQANRVLAVRGKVVPAAPVPITLHARLGDGSRLEGQSRIARARNIERVWIEPADARACDEAVEAINNADMVVLGPGSLFTSLLPNLLVPGIRTALEQAAAPRVFVSNVATQVGETENFMLTDHLAVLAAHGLEGLVDAVLANDNFNAHAPAGYPAAPVRIDIEPGSGDGPLIIPRDVVDDGHAHHHDPGKLAAAIVGLHDERRVARREAAGVGR